MSIDEMCMSPIYARDLKPELLNDSFLGKGAEEKLRIAEKANKELIVGYWLKVVTVED